jgi:acetyl-CoA carboxylase biotin carboxyl carrier protein
MTNPLDHIEELTAWLAATDIGLLELSGPLGAVRLLNDGVSVHVADGAAPIPTDARIVGVRSPSVGVFLDRHPLHERAIATIGAAVQAGEPLGFLRVGPLLTPVLAPQAGTVSEVLVEHSTVVGYGTPLFELQPIGGGTS